MLELLQHLGVLETINKGLWISFHSILTYQLKKGLLSKKGSMRKKVSLSKQAHGRICFKNVNLLHI